LLFLQAFDYVRNVIQAWHLPLLLATGFVAGFVDSIAGGGGLITLPVILTLGLPPRVALGTNKLQATFGSASAAWHYARAGLVSFHEVRRAFLLALIGSAAGTVLVQHTDTSFLKKFLPVVLLAVAIYLLFKPETGKVPLPSRMPRWGFDLLFGLGLGFYDGFVGPGTGTFWTMAFVLLSGFTLTRATAATKMVNLASNISSLILFLARGEVVLAAGLAMGIGQWLGARAGARVVVRRGFRLIRPIFLTVVILLVLKLLWEAFGAR
jgi:uncharacterized membrane protein YfcA